ncbi:hypothetical protein ACFQX6_56500 [Streptosporangium lutulentum]
MRILGVLVAVGLLAVACGRQAPAAHPPEHSPAAAGIRLAGGGTLVAAAPKASAIVYDTALAPAGPRSRSRPNRGRCSPPPRSPSSGCCPTGRTACTCT